MTKPVDVDEAITLAALELRHGEVWRRTKAKLKAIFLITRLARSAKQHGHDHAARTRAPGTTAADAAPSPPQRNGHAQLPAAEMRRRSVFQSFDAAHAGLQARQPKPKPRLRPEIAAIGQERRRSWLDFAPRAAPEAAPAAAPAVAPSLPPPAQPPAQPAQPPAQRRGKRDIDPSTVPPLPLAPPPKAPPPKAAAASKATFDAKGVTAPKAAAPKAAPKATAPPKPKKPDPARFAADAPPREWYEELLRGGDVMALLGPGVGHTADAVAEPTKQPAAGAQVKQPVAGAQAKAASPPTKAKKKPNQKGKK